MSPSRLLWNRSRDTSLHKLRMATAAAVSTGSVFPERPSRSTSAVDAGPYSITIYRTGFFADGTTEQMMAVIDGLPSDPTPFPIARNAYKDGAQWPAVAQFVIPDWPSGLYLARVQTTGASSYPQWIFRLWFALLLGLLSPSCWCWRTAPTTPTTTGAAEIPTVICQEPTSSAPSPAPRLFASRLDFNCHSSGRCTAVLAICRRPARFRSYDGWRAEASRSTCARRGICTSSSRTPITYSLLLFVGHHEYWTSEMRTSVESFVKSGGNVAFFSGNVAWWQVRITPDGQRLLCYKVAELRSGLDNSRSCFDDGALVRCSRETSRNNVDRS